MKAIKSTWKTLTDSMRIVSQSSSYSIYPLLSYSVILLATFAAIIPLFEAVLGLDQKDVLARVLFFLAVYLAYGALYLVIVFCNVALITGIAARLDGDDPGLAAGIVRASQRIGSIALSTLVSATLGLLSFLARTLIDPLFGMIIAPRVGDKLWVRWHQL